MPTPSPDHGKNARIDRAVDVRLMAPDGAHQLISSASHTINVSEHGLLMEVPQSADVVLGQQVMVHLEWEGGTFESTGEVVRFESPYWKDGFSSVMGLRLEAALPPELLSVTAR